MTLPGGWLSALAGDDETASRMGEDAQRADMLRVEAAYSRALGAVGQVPRAEAEEAAAAISAARIDAARLARAAARDGVPVPDLVRQIREQVPERLHRAVHRGLTSQDVTDNALLLALRAVCETLRDRLDALEAALVDLEGRFGANTLMGRTRMQAALPVTAGDRLAQWRRPLADHRARLDEVGRRLFVLQLGGPVGTRGSFDRAGDAIAAGMAAELGLSDPGQAWHTRRDALADFANWLSLVSGSLGKMGHDLALMTQQGIDAARVAGGGGSSAMGHKANPVRAEVLVALARYNAVQLPGMHLALDHEQERSGVAWTLEWLVLPAMVVTTAAGLRTALSLAGDIEAMGDPA